MSPPFAVIDFETTGLVPEKHDRVVEVGVVLLDSAGGLEWEWSSLINPKRDIGPTRIHGITAREVLDAPEFSDIADPLLDALRGRVVVAHNASFDMRFLHYELDRAGYAIPLRPEAMCSMKWARRLVGPAKLAHCCETLGIDLVGAHSALGDARATAQLVTWLSRQGARDPEWGSDVERVLGFGWPGSHLAGQAPRSAERAASSVPPNEHAWLDTILANTWVSGATDSEASYLVTLDAALLDRNVSSSEGQQLIQSAEAVGLSAQRVDELHRDHLEFLAEEAWSDGVLTDEEKSDLDRVAKALRLTPNDVESALARAEAGHRHGEHTSTSEAFLRAGDRVVFTGSMQRPRDEWVEAIVAAGLSSGGVTKSTRVLVTADPDSMSGKAAKARSHGVPVVDEATFDRMLSDYLSDAGNQA